MKIHLPILLLPVLLSDFLAQGFAPTTSAFNNINKINTINSKQITSSSSSALFERMAEKVLSNPKWPAEWPYTPQDLDRMDETEDTIFYETPRLCTHIDDPAIQALTNHYATEFKDGDDVLDICSSWISHYPKSDAWKQPGNVVGLGMNEYELSQNNMLNSYNIKDLNVDPTFPYEDSSFDKVTCVVSVDYLNKPKEIFEEIGRVLKPGGMAMIAISNRCFPTKAWNLWLRTNDMEHVFIVGSFFHFTSGVFEEPVCKDVSPNPGASDPMFIIKGMKKVAVSVDENDSDSDDAVVEVTDDADVKAKSAITANADDNDNDNDNDNGKTKGKRKNVMDFLKSKGAVGRMQDFSKAKGVDEGPEDKSLQDLKAIQGIRGGIQKKWNEWSNSSLI